MTAADMEKDSALTPRAEAGALETVNALQVQLERTNQIMASMAGMLKAACAKIDQLERQVRWMERITPTQATALNALIRLRSKEVCREYRIEGHEKAVNMLIRNAIRDRWGVATKDLPKVELGTCSELVRMWENAEKLTQLREKAADET